jgi:hydrogenase/urease accessory protein HupE
MRAAAMLTVALTATVSLSAHDPGLSALDVRLEKREIIAVLSVAAADVDVAGGRQAFLELARGAVTLSIDGRPLAPLVQSVWTDDGGLHVRLAAPLLDGARLTVESRIPDRLARGHRELASIRTEHGRLLADRMLDARFNQATVDVSGIVSEAHHPFTEFFTLGIRHILTGYDHLLFLAGVLVMLRRWRDVIQTITAFTLAHSITLALATTGIVAVPGRIVEPLIAASIVFVGVENLLRGAQGSRWKLTFVFGLMHGLGFATALRELGVGTIDGMGIAGPLASFNAGVEAGQIAVAAGIVPLFWALSRRPAPRLQFASVWSCLVVVAGGYWLAERTVFR